MLSDWWKEIILFQLSINLKKRGSKKDQLSAYQYYLQICNPLRDAWLWSQDAWALLISAHAQTNTHYHAHSQTHTHKYTNTDTNTHSYARAHTCIYIFYMFGQQLSRCEFVCWIILSRDMSIRSCYTKIIQWNYTAHLIFVHFS